MGVFGSGGDNNVEIKVILDAVSAIEQVEKLEAKINKLEESGQGGSEKTLLLKDALDKLKNTSKETEQGFTSLQAKIITFSEAIQLGKIAGELFVGALKAFPNMIMNLADAGATLGDLEQGFESLGGATKTIEDASDRINGILPNIDLLRIANQAMAAGLPEVNKNFADVVEYGKRMGDTLGMTAKEGVEALNQALISGREVMLKKLGIIIDSDKAYADYTKTMGITGRELSELEKKTAITAQGLEILRGNLTKMPEANRDVQDGIEGIRKQLIDLVGETGKAINNNENLTLALKKLGEEIGSIDVTALANDIANLASDLLSLLPNIGDTAKSLADWARAASLAASAGLDLIQSLQAVASPLVIITKLLQGQIPSLEEIKKSYVDIANIGLNNYNKKLAEHEKRIYDNIKATNEYNASKEEHKALIEEEAKLHEQELGQLKAEEDARDALKKKLEKEAKAREEAGKAQEQATKTAIKALDQLQTDIRDFSRSDDLANMETALAEAFKVGDTQAIQAIQKDIETAVRDGIADGHAQAGGTFNAESLEAIQIRAEQETGVYIQKAKETAEKSKWSLFDTILGGAFSDQSIDEARQQMEQVASNVESSIASAISLGLEGGFNSETIKGLASSLGSALGTTFLGPIGGALAGWAGGKFWEVIAKVGQSTEGTSNALRWADTIFPGLGSGASSIVSGVFGSGKGSANEEALSSLDRFIEETLASRNEEFGGYGLNLGNLDTSSFFSQFEGDWSTQFWQDFEGEGATAFQALGMGLTDIAGIGEDVGGQLGYILANNLTGNIDQARLLLLEMGVGAQDLEQVFQQMGLTGEQSWHTVETYMQSIGTLTDAGLVGMGDLGGAMIQFAESAGTGQQALIGLRNIGIEAMEAGASTMEDLRAHMIASGKYSAEQISAVMTGFEQRGITSLEGIRDASDRTLGGVTADAESLGFAWSESVGQGLEDSIENVNELKKVIGELPDEVEKSIVLKVRTEYSGEDARMLYSDLRNDVGVKRA